MQLDIANHGKLKLPLDFVTERIAFLARTGAGKSGGMRVLQEEMIAAGQFVVIIDPVKGDLWGIRAAGRSAGLPVLVMGGDHGDVPLQHTAGKIIADFLVRERVSTVLDLSDFGKAEMVKFMTDFASTLYRRNRDVMHVFIDEADAVAGEKFYDPKCLEAIQMIQNKGRGRGFGVTVATQRSAIVNKSVLFASGTLIVMQTTSPKDVAVAKEWLDVCGTPDVTKQILSELPKLSTREAFVYSPQLLGPEPKRITFRSFETFDSMRTPKPGEARRSPKSLAQIDLSAVQRDMAATIEEAKANDPAELRKEIAALKRQLNTKAPIVDEKATERAVSAAVSERDRHWKTEVAKLEKAHGGIVKRLQSVAPLATKIAELASLNGAARVEVAQPAAVNNPVHKSHPVLTNRAASERPKRVAPRAPTYAAGENTGDLPRGEAKVLAALIQFPDGLAREQLTVLTGYKRSSRDAYLQRLREKGLVDTDGAAIVATDAGVAALPDAEPLPTGEELQDYWRQRLPAGEQAILEVLIGAYPEPVDREALSEVTGYKRSSRDAYLQRMKAKQLIEVTREGIIASDTLF